MKKNTIVLCADADYKRQILVTVKSICQHNRNIQFYLLHQNIEEEWVEALHQKLLKYDCNMKGILMEKKDFASFRTYSHISPATYLRYFIPEKIEEERLLYLDGDLIVRGDLTPLFEVELGDAALAAAWDMISLYEEEQEVEFNAGVLLIDNKKWREKEVGKKALELHREKDEALRNADQSVLNLLFQNEWIPLPSCYNLQVGVEWIRKLRGDKREIIKEKQPLIVHFTTSNKPWNPRKLGICSRIRLRKVLKLRELISGRAQVLFGKEWRAYEGTEL